MLYCIIIFLCNKYILASLFANGNGKKTHGPTFGMQGDQADLQFRVPAKSL